MLPHLSAITSLWRGDFRPLRFAVYCSRLACCFAFHAAYSRCPCPSSPCRARRTLTGMILQQMACRRKSSRPFCVTWFVSLFLLTFYSPFCRGVTLIYMKSCGAESFQSGRIWRYIGIYGDTLLPASPSIPNFILSFTCPKTLDLSGFSPFFRFLVRPFYALFL